ncbi:DUF397 domain-containing protein [Streptomyces sp. NPDC057654]|uniref:DUF397 domain-containing protein n=1 Tax=Streptomyces sp. NPDC057654 TaxID=3346196 RepID=UPI0036B2CF4B
MKGPDVAAVIAWQKSSFSSDEDAPNCLELAAVDGVVLLRESEAPASVLSLTRGALSGLVRHVKAGGADGGFGLPIRP